jgi:ectoine hydroxylase-related dioxygenase (phytanoyl-CoA dioxygenase family)
MSSARMSVWIPLQDCDENNGCLWLVPGSHREGFVDTHERRETGVCTLSLRDGAEDIEGAIPCPISAGEVILFDALTWHRSLGNRTGKTRRSFIVSYQDALTTGAARGQHRILRPAPQDEST